MFCYVRRDNSTGLKAKSWTIRSLHITPIIMPNKGAGEESWNEAEDGDGNSEKKVTEESASDCPSSPSVGDVHQNLRIPAGYSEEYHQELQQTLMDMMPKNAEVYRGRLRRDVHNRDSQSHGHPTNFKTRTSSNSRRSEKSIERISTSDTHSLLWQKASSNNSHSNLNKLNHAKQQLGFSSGRNESTRSRSSDAPDLTEVDISEAEDGDEQRRKTRSSSSRSRTPDIPSSELNGSPGPFSHQQILQAAAAGLPYFHLLPPALRNDAARYLFIPPVLPGADLQNAVVASSTPNSGATSATPTSIKSEKITTGENSRSAPVYLCEPCNIKFSSARTLEAHQTYYCSFRKDTGKDGDKNDADGDSKGESATISSQSGTGGGKKRERESSGEERELGIDETGEISGTARGLSGSVSDSIGSNSKNLKTGKLYSCIYCSYSADKKVSLNRHMRMHSGPPISAIQMSNNSNDEQGPSANSNNSTSSNIGVNKNLPEGVNALERYCQDCDIQFSSIKTYRVHKQYYCSTRHVLKAQQAAAAGVATAVVPGPPIGKQQGVEIGGGITVTPIRKTSGSPLPPEGSPISTPGPMPPQPFVILPTNPVIIVPYCFIQGASILPGNVLPSQNALVVLPNGTVHGLPATVMPMPMPPPSPSPSQSHGGGIPSHFMHNSYSASGNNLNNNSANNSNANGNSSMSPNSQSQSVFNDPKDIIRKICSTPRNQSNSAESTHSESSVGNNHRRNSTSGGAKTPVAQSSSVIFSKENDENIDTDADIDAEADTETYNEGGVCDESMPAIDLTLRNIQPKKERLSVDEEKENREVALSRVGSHSHILGGGNGIPSSLVHLDFHRDRELSSPSERLSVGSGSGSGGKRTPRPSSTSISSSCSTPPALCEPKINGILSRGSPSGRDRDESPSHGGINPQVNNKNSMMMMMMNANSNAGNSKKGSGGVDYSVLEMSKLRGGGGSISSGGKMSPIATQLPGGAILTSATSQSLAELLMSNPPELNESLAKLNPQVLLNSRSTAGSPLGLNLNFNPAMLSALTPELAMRFLEPTYLASLQHSLQQQSLVHQQQQQQQQQQSQQTQQVPPPKRGVSKCIECDIVFYKYENFLVHKEHYCAARTTNQQTITGSIATNLKSPSRESGGKESQSQSRMSSCSSPTRSDAEVEESLSPLSCPTPVAPHPNKNKSSGSNASTRSQTHSNLQRKSPDSSVEITIPVESHSTNLSKSKSKSPVAISTPLSISPISSPKDSKDTPNCKEKPSAGASGAQYPCLQCGVKYSTLDNLQTHQAFYCTKRIASSSCENNNNSCSTNQTESKTHSEVKTNTNNNNKGFLKCGKCKLAIPEDQMGSHSRVCNGSNGSSCASSVSSGASNSNTGMAWKCPCCDIYSPTVSAAQKHLETHTGIRAFKCLLCGYRGNTLRGMRTHIRMHFDKRVSDIQEGEYITCITANDPEQNNTAGASISTRGAAAVTVPPALTIPSPDQNHRNVSPNRVELEKERERLNHSPRSGKGSTASSSAPMSPAEVSLSGDKLENNNRLHFCHLCNYSSSYKGNVVRHMKLVHKISEESADEIVSAAAALSSAHANTNSTMNVRSPPEEVNGADSRDSNSNSKCSTDFVSSVSISVSSAKAAASATVSPQHLHSQNHNDSSSQSSSSTDLAGSLNPPRPSSANNLTNNKNANINNNQKPTNTPKTKNPGAGANLTVNGIGATGSGGESHSGSENENNETRKCSSRSSSDEDLTLTTIQKKEKPCAVKYCKSCNIPFNYLSTFNAHKKFYCPGHSLVSSTDPEAPERAETPVQ